MFTIHSPHRHKLNKEKADYNSVLFQHYYRSPAGKHGVYPLEHGSHVSGV